MVAHGGNGLGSSKLIHHIIVTFTTLHCHRLITDWARLRYARLGWAISNDT